MVISLPFWSAKYEFERKLHEQNKSVSSGFSFRLTESELLDKLLKETGEDSLKVLDAQLKALDSGKVVLTLYCCL